MKIVWLISTFLLTLPFMALADATGFVPLVGIPYVNTQDGGTLGDYVNGLYIAVISVAAILAVLMIIYAGVEYALSDVVTTKAKAKKRIQGAIVGLIIVVSAFLILNTINPSINKLTLLDLKALQVETGGNDNVNGDKTLDELIDELCLTDQGNICNVESCGLSLNCSAWCASRGGIMTDNPGPGNDECFYVPQPGSEDDDKPRVDEESLGYINCDPINAFREFDENSCNRAKAECEAMSDADGSTRWVVTGDGSFISCLKKTGGDNHTIETRTYPCETSDCKKEDQRCEDENGIPNHIFFAGNWIVDCKIQKS